MCVQQREVALLRCLIVRGDRRLGVVILSTAAPIVRLITAAFPHFWHALSAPSGGASGR